LLPWHFGLIRLYAAASHADTTVYPLAGFVKDQAEQQHKHRSLDSPIVGAGNSGVQYRAGLYADAGLPGTLVGLSEC